MFFNPALTKADYEAALREITPYFDAPPEIDSDDGERIRNAIDAD